MDLFKSSSSLKNEYLSRYVKMATRFQNIGIAIVALSIAVNYFGGARLAAVSYVVFAVGALSLVFGGSSLRPHNLIRSFAQLCTQDPNKNTAEGLLEAMERYHKTGLTKASISAIDLAIATYAQSPESDPDLTERLKQAASKRLVKKII